MISTGQASGVVVPSLARHLWAASGELVLTSLLISVLSLALPLTMLHIYDRVLASAGLGTFWMLAIGVVVAALCELVLRALRGGIVARAGAVWEAKAHARAMERLTQTPIASFERFGTGVYLERLASIATVREAYSGAAFQALLDLPFCVLYVAAIFHLSERLALVPIIMALAFIAVSLLVGGRLRRSVTTLSEGEERRFNMLFDILSNVHTVKALALEQQMLRRYERLMLHCVRARSRLAALSGHGHGASLLLSNIGSGLVAALGCIEVLDGRLTVGGLGACLLLTSRALQPLSSALNVFSRAEVLRGAARRLAEIEALAQPATAGAPPLHVRGGEVRFEGVVVRRPDGAAVLDGLDLVVPAHGIVGVTARNGAGKTTLLRAVMGMVVPSRGRILIDGQDVTQVQPDSVVAACAYLPTQGSLIRGTLIENLTMHRPLLAARARAIVSELSLDALVAMLPQGYDTMLGEGGVMLPRGAVQMVAIARTLVAQPRIILFDEANVFVDAGGDRALHAMLQRLRRHCTIILVSSRPSTLALADQRFVLADGRVQAAA